MGRPEFYAVLAMLMATAMPAGAERVPTGADTHAVWLALSTAPDSERSAWRWRLGRDYAAGGLYAEADGVLRALAADDPARSATREFRLLHAQVLSALGEHHAALVLLDSPAVEGQPVTCLRRLVAASGMSRHNEVRANLRCAETAIAALPSPRRARYMIAGVRAEIALGDVAAAERLLARTAQTSAAESGEAAFWRGVIARRRGQNGLATDHFRQAAASPNPPAALRAEVALVELQLADGSLTPAAAASLLRDMEHVWRGGTAERDLLLASGRIADLTGNVHDAFRYYGTAAQYLASAAQAPSLRAALSERFAAIFADGGQQLEPLDAFSLFWDFREFTPQGPAADAMVRRLADRLAALGLNAQAASLLEHQVYNRLEGSARGQVAIRLAGLLNDASRYAQALAVLADTQGDGLPSEALAARRLAEAAALIGVGRAAEAKSLLAEMTGYQAHRLRGEAAWAARDWNGVIANIEGDLPVGDAVRKPQVLTMLLRVTVAAAMEGDEALLRRLNRNYSGNLSGTGIEQAFEILTGNPAAVSAVQLRAALAAAAERASASASPSEGRPA